MTADIPGSQELRLGGEPVALVLWAHDFADRAQTGWFMVMLDDAGEPDGRPPVRLEVAEGVEALIADPGRDRAAWLAQAETVELVTAPAALAAGERALRGRLDPG